MVDFSRIQLIEAGDTHYEFAYRVKKAAEGEYITTMFGWDESFQRDWFDREWRQGKPAIIVCGDAPIGTIFVVDNGEYLEIKRFFLLPEYQNQGIGSHVLKGVLDDADKQRCPVQLAYLKNNPVGSLYRRLGFRVTGASDFGVFMERPVCPSGTETAR